MDISDTKDVSVKALWLLFAIAAISFVFTLNLSHIGEEGVYTISSFEMWYNNNFLYPLLYGGNYGRPPLLNWLIISLAKGIGWSHMLLASRLIAAVATVGTGFVLAWLVQNIFHDKRFAAFSALAYLTTDALFYHGWLAYSDPLFAFCVFVSIACLWVSCERERFGLLVVAILALTAAFLTKAVTAYVFYISAFLILMCLGKRKFLMRPISVFLHLIAFGAIFLWPIVTNNVSGGSLIRDILYWGWQDGQGTQVTTYLIGLIAFPAEVFVKILPVSVIAVYYFWRGYGKTEVKHDIAVKFLILFIGISFFPYWLTTKHSVRYILPLYPFMALLCSYVIWNVNEHSIRIALRWFIAAIIIKYLSVIFWWPYYQTVYRGDYVGVARDVVSRTQNKYLLYTNDPAALEHSIIDNINILHYPSVPVHSISLRPSEENDYFMFTVVDNFNSGKIVKEYVLGKSNKKVYLLCYGKACS
jgi:4-amino-4-deoxy-L-arabinose transferase-like glycosyltransferase